MLLNVICCRRCRSCIIRCGGIKVLDPEHRSAALLAVSRKDSALPLDYPYNKTNGLRHLFQKYLSIHSSQIDTQKLYLA
jgi:hypothetical protein